MQKSRPDRYGTVAVSIHWLSALLILALLAVGFLAANTADALAKASLLRLHVPVGIAVLLLTVLRIVWWWRFDVKPPPAKGGVRWQEGLARGVHVVLYVVILGMVASGIGMVVLSGAGPAIFGEPGAVMPTFTDYLPRAVHGLGAFLLVALLVLHVAAALYHHYIRGDGLLRRMWYGREV